MKRASLLGPALLALLLPASCTAVLGVTDVPGAGDGGDDGSGGSSGGTSSGSSSGTSSSSSGGTSSSSSSGGTASCPLKFTVPACGTCIQDHCVPQCQACEQDHGCSTYITCVSNCGQNSSCLQGCSTALTAAGQTSVNVAAAFLSDPTGCFYSSCRAQCGTPEKIGDPCFVAADCASGICVTATEGWCTETCTSNAQCGTNSAGVASWCVKNTGGSDSCFRECTSVASCAPITCASGKTLACTSATTISPGVVKNICVCQ